MARLSGGDVGHRWLISVGVIGGGGGVPLTHCGSLIWVGRCLLTIGSFLTLEAAGGIEPPYGALQLQKRGSSAFA
jgi:hypothetical protein